MSPPNFDIPKCSMAKFKPNDVVSILRDKDPTLRGLSAKGCIVAVVPPQVPAEVVWSSVGGVLGVITGRLQKPYIQYIVATVGSKVPSVIRETWLGETDDPPQEIKRTMVIGGRRV